MQIQENSNQLRAAVVGAIQEQPEVTSPDISVGVRDGVIALAGFVSSNAEKTAAERAALLVNGVNAVANDIEVVAAGMCCDPEIAKGLVSALANDIRIPRNGIRASVKEGYVTLEGNVDWNFQKVAAAAGVAHAKGVRGVSNNIAVNFPVSPSEVIARIEDALKREALKISVSAVGETVHLFGKVGSWLERVAAETAAAEAPGVGKVVDHTSIAA
jgi:osmotically-inducible protein OsmY